MSQYVHDVWSTNDGLPQAAVNAIAQTSDGYLWVATQEGLARFDGVTFTTFDSRTTGGVMGNFVYVLHVDHAGTLWIGAKGLVRFKDGKAKVYTTKDGLASDQVWQTCADARGNVWIGTASGLDLFANGTFTHYL